VSGTGTLHVDVAALTAATGVSSGFLNISDGTGWVVQNLPVNSGLGGVSTNFNLGTADGVNDSGVGITLAAQFSSTPLTGFSAVGSASFPVVEEA